MPTLALDPVYFSDAPWGVRLQKWLAGKDESFLEGNHRLVRQIMENEESGLRMVVNISADALLSFLAARRQLISSPIACSLSVNRLSSDKQYGPRHENALISTTGENRAYRESRPVENRQPNRSFTGSSRFCLTTEVALGCQDRGVA